jgi:hypothetical protein
MFQRFPVLSCQNRPVFFDLGQAKTMRWNDAPMTEKEQYMNKIINIVKMVGDMHHAYIKVQEEEKRKTESKKKE